MTTSASTDRANIVRIKFMEASDIGLTIGLAILATLSWLFSIAGCKRFAGRFAHLNSSTLGADRTTIARVSGGDDRATSAMLEQLGHQDLFATILALREHRPGTTFPPTRVRGLHHLQRAQAAGDGTILWVAHVVHGALGVKVALNRAGIAVSHLSHPRHGFSSTRFGRIALNWLRTRVENRHLRERVMIDEREPKAALAVLRERLAQNGVVSITARDDARRPTRAPFMCDALALAPGAPVLARKSGATLLPVTAFEAADGVIEVHVGPAVPRAHRRSVEAITACYTRWTEAVVKRQPHQWLGWLHL